MTDEKKHGYVQRILRSRMRILIEHPFFGVLLMHMKFAIDEGCETAKTDGRYIAFGPAFLDELDDRELDFIMMHEIMHVALQHVLRQGDREPEIFNIACDIVVNSNIMLENGSNLRSITLRKYGESMYQLPDGTEGHATTAEAAYEELLKYIKFAKACGDIKEGRGSGGRGGKSKDVKGKNGSCKGGSDRDGNDGDGSGKDGSDRGGNGRNGRGNGGSGKNGKLPGIKGYQDDHSDWGKYADDPTLRDEWRKHFKDAYDVMRIRDPENGRGTIPAFAERAYKELMKNTLDWKTVLTNFIQENVKDYTLCPPDKRYSEGPFLLPDFNDQDSIDVLHKVLFMIDTSGSITDDMMTQAYSEIKGAIDQFDGNISGWLGFFDAVVYEPVPFCDEEELKGIRPRGGGGTRFDIIFQYVQEYMSDELPSNIVILTDGYAPFPEEKEAMGIPVLWVINNEEVEPKWGKVARIEG